MAAARSRLGSPVARGHVGRSGQAASPCHSTDVRPVFGEQPWNGIAPGL